jgi:hypothetical protein
MKLETIKKPTKLNPKFTAIISPNGESNIYEFDNYTSAINFYIKAKKGCGEKFIN